MIRMNRHPRRDSEQNDTQPSSLDTPSPPDQTQATPQPDPEIADSDNKVSPTNEDTQDCLQETAPDTAEPTSTSAGKTWQRLVAYGLLPGLAMLTAGGAGYLKWLQTNAHETQSARIESVQAATESTIKILSYSPDSVDHDLDSARERLTGTFRDAYTQLTHDVVIPGSKQKKISAVATVPAATSISASPTRAEVMVFVNQTIMVGNDPPSNTASTVKVTMDKHDNRWLVSDFTPI